MAEKGSHAGTSVIVTGASRGIGLAIAEAFVREQAHVTLIGRDGAALDVAAARLGDRVATVAGSAEDPATIDAAIRAALSFTGRIDTLVNNAGGPPPDAPLVVMPMADFDGALSFNLRTPLLWVRAAWRASMREHGGAIVNIASIGGLSAPRGMGAYSVAKAGLLQMTRMFAAELGPHIRVNAIAPGIVRTDATAAVNYQGYAEMVPLGRVGEPEDIAEATLFLAGPGAAWTTGQTLAIEGGTLIQTGKWKRGWQQTWQGDDAI